MIKAIFYKEWIKTRMYIILSVIVSLCITAYAIVRLQRVIKIKGVEHLWEILLSRDTVFIEILQYVPLLMGIIMAVVQFIPEMQQKRIKLTLHLPFEGKKMILLMLFYGILTSIIIYFVHFIILWSYLENILAPILIGRILLTALPWFICGVMSYLLCAWVILEPTWRRRMVSLLVSAGLIRVFFLSAVPQSYDVFLLTIVPMTIAMIVFPLLSVQRFKSGCQD
ncbi:MAG: hypothetical protein PHD21_02900 [Flavobacteriales bacterium]|nr:hypothetical protein [Flavobacteriales bacterium]